MKPEQKRMVMAMVLSALVLIAWEKFFAPKKFTPVQKVVEAEISSIQKTRQNTHSVSKTRNVQKNTEFKFQNIKELLLTNGTDTVKIQNNFNIIDLVSTDSKRSFGEILGKSRISLNIEENGVLREILFDQFEKYNQKITAHNSLYNITVIYSITKNSVHYSISSDKKYRYNFSILSEEKTLPNSQIRQFIVYNEKDVDRYSIDDDDSGDSKIKWFGVDFDYHLFVNILDKTETALYRINNNLFSTTLVNATDHINGTFIFVFKKYDLLSTIGNKGDNLQLAIDFGFFGIVAVPMLRVLQFFYKYLSNYGLAIIFLTIVLRLITFPLQFKSFKSMKKMQVIQPELAKIKEKFKDNPQKIQQETMALFKKAGANPIGGCLPMILQMPIFFAFYKVLYSAVELVDAPFYFWIHDLSIKDPYYVLPVLMTLTMVVQNKLNPTATIDPTQKKMMMFMPLIFGFIMKDLPAGLNLYMTVSMALGSAQQLMVYKYSD